MKARILRTNFYTPKLSEGEIVDIIQGMETDAEGVWNAPAGKLVLCRKEDNTFTYASPLDMEIFEYDTTDWDAFRREAAKDILCAIVSHDGFNYHDPDQFTADAIAASVGMAGALIQKLKEEHK